MVARDWDWQISQVGDNDFSMIFPSTDLLNMAKTISKLFLSINDITARVCDTVHEEVVPMVMPEAWVRLHDIPNKHRRVDRLMEGLKMMGRPIVVDEFSLIRLVPVRVKFACKVPDKLNGTVQDWFNHEGYEIKIELERLPKRSREGPSVLGPSDKPPKPSDKRGHSHPLARTARGRRRSRAKTRPATRGRMVVPQRMLTWTVRMRSSTRACRTPLLILRPGTSWASRSAGA